MSTSYDNMMGSPMDVEDHPAYNKPTATQHYAGDVVPLPISPGPNSGPTPNSVDYALGKKQDPKILPIGNQNLSDWMSRMTGK